MIKLIASDLDGTLLLHGAQALNPEIYDLILALKKKGIHFIATSGRQIASQRNLFRPIADEISYIAENGAVCIYKNEVISTFSMDTDLAFRIIQSIKGQLDCLAVVSGAETCYIESGDDEFLYHVRHVLNNDTTVVDDFSEIQEPIVKIAFFDRSGTYASLDYFKEKFQKEIKVVTSGNDWIDFVPFGINKGAALRIMLEKLGIQAEEMIAFGDQENDLEMLQLAGTSYAMATAPDSVKQIATATTETVEEVLRELLASL
ncbi:MAG: HAD family phosphatase [Tyzzerella sp.]|nr:HAD family phosphatase [Tyzzerella sp.]